MIDRKKEIINNLPEKFRIRLNKIDQEISTENNFSNDVEYSSENFNKINSMIDKGTYYKTFEEKTMNLSVKVNDRMSTKKKRSKKRLLIPALSLVVIFIILLNRPQNSNLNIELLNQNDLKFLVENNSDQEIISESIFNDFDATLSVIDNSQIEEIAEEELQKITLDLSNDYLISLVNENDIINNLNSLEEEQIQYILKELENAKIIN